MSSIRCLIRACLSFALATAAGCAPSPSIDYRVTVRPSRTPEVIVEAEVRDAPRNGLTFQAHTEQEVMRLAGVEAFDGRGVPIPREVRYRPIVARGKRVAVPFVTIPGPVPDRMDSF